MFLRPAFSLNIDTLHRNHPELSRADIDRILDAAMASQALHEYILDTFDEAAAKDAATKAQQPKTPLHPHTLRLALMMADIRALDKSTVRQGPLTTIPAALWSSFLKQWKTDQPPHYSSNPN